jgi:hypothetical protein
MYSLGLCRRPHGVRCIVLQIFSRLYIFAKSGNKNVKKKIFPRMCSFRLRVYRCVGPSVLVGPDVWSSRQTMMCVWLAQLKMDSILFYRGLDTQLGPTRQVGRIVHGLRSCSSRRLICEGKKTRGGIRRYLLPTTTLLVHGGTYTRVSSACFDVG